MRRGFWFAAGAGAGIYAMIRGRRAAEAFTADGARDRLQALAHGARIFRDEVVTGKAEAEMRLRERFGPGGHLDELDTTLEPPSLVPRDGGATNELPSPEHQEGQQ